MNVCRRDFLSGLAVAGVAELAGGCLTSAVAKDGRDPNLSVFLSDIHVAHLNPRDRKETEQFVYQNPYFEKTVDDILKMRPLPARAVVFGDIALWYGWDRDYEMSRPGIERLKAAGIAVTLTMGNHDHRDAFFRAWPEYAKSTPVPGRVVSVVDLGTADLFLLDSLDENPAGEGSKNAVAGVLDVAQQDWLMTAGRAAKRPFLVGSHHPVKELAVGDRPLMDALAGLPQFAGYVHGHEHRWYARWHRQGWSSPRIIRCACLPSTGWWGDIGFATLKTFPDRAVLTLEQRDFFFPKPLKEGMPRPQEWDDVLEEHRGAQCVFRFR